MARILTIGEPLVEFVAMHKGDLSKMDRFESQASGAELAYAVGMARLGYEVLYVTKLGKDPMGKYLHDFIYNHEINTDYIEFVNKLPTGLGVRAKSNENGWPEFHYHRKGTAATTMTKEFVGRVDFTNITHMHVTGIAVSISESAREAVMELISLAHQNDVTVSFDPNIRPILWESEAEMCRVINGISLLCDIIFPEYEEAVKLLGLTDPDEIADFYLSSGVKTVVIKSQDKGIFVKNKKVRFWASPYDIKHAVDLTGVGEGFVVGVTSAILEGRNLVQAVERGRAVAANVAEFVNSYDGLPTRDGLIDLIKKFHDMSVEEFLAKNLLVPERRITDDIESHMKENAHQQLDPVRTSERESLLDPPSYDDEDSPLEDGPEVEDGFHVEADSKKDSQIEEKK